MSGHAFTEVVRHPPDAATMRHLGSRIGRLLHRGEVVLLQGDLGAGKTTLVAGIAEGLGIDPRLVSSPTFVLCQEYARVGSDGDRESTTLVHVDAWRMRGVEDLESIGWSELLADPRAITCVEWPERIPEAVAEPRRDGRTIEVHIEHEGSGRCVRIVINADRAAALGEVPDGPPSRCRTCGGAFDPDGPDAPFCSERCRLADLHRWFVGEHRIERPLTEDDLLE